MKKFWAVLLIMLCCLYTTSPGVNATKTTDIHSSKPCLKADGSKWQIGYCESESFITYSQTLVGIIKGLKEIGWLTDLDGFDQAAAAGDSKIIWQWLCSHEVSPYIEFADDTFYNLKDPGTDRNAIVKKLNDSNDIDIMLVMGGAAGSFLSNSPIKTNIFVFAASNAVRSGIIASVDDSGKDNVWAHMDENRFERQLRAFYDIVKFKKIGMVYENSDNARVYSAVNEVESLAKEKGFEIVRYYVNEPRSPEEYPEYYREVQEAYNKLAGETDAMYVTIASLESDKLPVLLQPFYEHKIPIFSQLGNIEVKNGALLTVSVMDEVNIGRFGADNISRCLLGAKPRDLQQSFQSAPKISINTEAAKKIGFKLPFNLVMVVDEVYQNIGD